LDIDFRVMNNSSYNISLPEFEGPFDLLLFFIERDELDIYDIPIFKVHFCCIFFNENKSKDVNSKKGIR